MHFQCSLIRPGTTSRRKQDRRIRLFVAAALGGSRFETINDIALRITQAAISMARSIPLVAQAHVAVETVDDLRKYGLKGIYGLILRKEFLAAADLLCRACDIKCGCCWQP